MLVVVIWIENLGIAVFINKGKVKTLSNFIMGVFNISLISELMFVHIRDIPRVLFYCFSCGVLVLISCGICFLFLRRV